jgi:superfamily II DNA or RNA helicase
VTITLFDYQQQALDAEAEHRRDHPEETRLAIVLPTGTGKGVIIAERALRFLESFDGAGCCVLIIVHIEELVGQLAATCEFLSESHTVEGERFSVGIVKAERNDIDADIIVASRQTLEDPARRAQISNVGLVIVDECHLGYTAYAPIMEYSGALPDCDHAGRDEHGCGDCRNTGFTHEPTPALGFTATLERSDGAGLGQVWQDVAFTRSLSWAVRRGYLVQPVGYRLEIPDAELDSEDPSKLDAALCDSIAPGTVVAKWAEIKAEREEAFMPTILFAPLVRSARAFADSFETAGITVAVVHGAMPKAERARTIADFKAGRIEVLCNAMVLTAGFDHPGIRCVVIARPTRSRTLVVQMAGRGLRRELGIPVEDQSCALVFLHDGATDLCSVADLSDKPLPRDATGALTAMEDEYDIGAHLAEAARHWTGKVDATKFDPIVARSSKAWARTKGGAWFLPISKRREYVFLVGTRIYVLTRPDTSRVTVAEVASAPTVELAMTVAEDEAAARGGDVGALLADRTRAWRRGVPSDAMKAHAVRLGLPGELERIMASRASGKAGKVSDLLRRVEASRSIDKMVKMINEKVEVSA